MKQNTGRRPALGLAARLGAVALVIGGLGISPELASADSTNEENVNSQTVEQPGAETVDNGGAANAGPAVTFSDAIVSQINVQVVAGDAETEANSTQTASNTANIDQLTGATSGDATASDGGTANSGAAVAGTLAVVHQANIQVIAGVGCDVDQSATNVADINQTAVASSGDATAEGEGSSASSGDASALALDVVIQRNVQIAVCTPGSDVTGQQVAENVGGMDQTIAAATGTAGASDGSDATSGNAEGEGVGYLNQSNRQVTID